MATPSILDSVGGPVPDNSIYERTDAKNLYLLGFVSKNARNSQLADMDFQLAKQGHSPDEIDAMHEAQRQQQDAEDQQAKAAAIAMHSLQGSDKDFQKSLDDMQAEMQNQPERQTAGAPQLSGMEAGLGFLSAILDPHHAAQNTNTVLQGAVNARNQKQNEFDKDYQVQQDQHEERIRYIEKVAQIQEARRNHAEQVVARSEALKAKGDEKHADDLQKGLDAYLRAVGTEKETAAKHYNGMLRKDEDHLKITDGRVQVDVLEDRVTKIDKAKKILTDANATPPLRLSAISELAQAGVWPYSGMSLADAQKEAENKGAKTLNTEAGTENKKADTVWKGEKTKTEKESRPQKVANLIKQGRVLDARALAGQAQANLTNLRAKYLPKEMDAKIRNLDARTKKAEREANDLIADLGSGKPVTATAFFNKHTQIETNLADLDARAEMWDQEVSQYEAKLRGIDDGTYTVYDKNGDPVDTKKAKQDLEFAKQEAQTAGTYSTSRARALRAVLTKIEKDHAPDPNAGTVRYKPGEVGPVTKRDASEIKGLGNSLVKSHGGRFEQFADRDIVGQPGKKSKHATGQAIDYFNTPERMTPLAESLTKNPDVTRIIYNHRTWTPEQGWHKYTGANPHTDHMHIEHVTKGSKGWGSKQFTINGQQVTITRKG